MMEAIDSLERLLSHYGDAVPGAEWKEIDHINEHYRLFIEKSPFLILSTIGDKGIDCSPRGDPPGFVRVVNRKCIQMPDRRGNNRLDSLRNIVGNPEVGIIFLIPNVGETIRLSGKARIVIDEELCASFSMKDKPASSVIEVAVEKVYFQCPKALIRSKLWDESSHIDRSELPTAGDMVEVFAEMNSVKFDGKEYDANYPDRLKKTIY